MEDRLEVLRNEIDKLVLNGRHDNVRMYISHMYGVSRFCTLLAMKRDLNVEIAAACGMLHDIFYMTGGTGGDHAANGARQAEEILKSIGMYTDDEIKLITEAVSKHSDKDLIDGPYDELLKDADVMDHCLYNTSFAVADNEADRYRGIMAEFGVGATK